MTDGAGRACGHADAAAAEEKSENLWSQTIAQSSGHASENEFDVRKARS